TSECGSTSDDAREVAEAGGLSGTGVLVDAPGVGELRRHLEQAAQAMAARRSDGLFRLAIDRVFTLPGHGTVVTGTAHGGMIDLDADPAPLVLMPEGRAVRVRSVHAQNQSTR